MLESRTKAVRCQWCRKTSMSDLHTDDSTPHLALRSNTQKKKDDKERVAKYSITAGWPETKLIIIIVKKAQRKPAAFPFPPQSNREAFSLHNDLQSDKTNRFAVTAWKGPARTPLLIMWPDLKPFSYSPSLCHLPTTPACSRGQQRMRLAQWWQATIQSLPAPHKPPSNERENLFLVEIS